MHEVHSMLIEGTEGISTTRTAVLVNEVPGKSNTSIRKYISCVDALCTAIPVENGPAWA